MKKTIEEMKAAVIAYCMEACPKTTKDAIEVNGITLHWVDHGHLLQGGLRMYGVADWMYIEEDMADYVALHAYRLLGLEARDKVEAKDKEIEALKANHQGTKDALERKQRSAKEMSDIYLALKSQIDALVEALEGIFAKCPRSIASTISGEALENHKKGSVDSYFSHCDDDDCEGCDASGKGDCKAVIVTGNAHKKGGQNG